MEIIKEHQKIRHSNGILFIREVYDSGLVKWCLKNLDVIDDTTSSSLEKEYQELINKPAETTNGEPKLRTALQRHPIGGFDKRIVVYFENKIVAEGEWSHPEGRASLMYHDKEYIQQGYLGEIFHRNLGS
jgi:hypothetical protein